MHLKKHFPEHVLRRGNAPKVRHYFAPRRNLPKGWPSSVRIPIDGEIRALGPESKIYWARLQLDAATLNDKLEKERLIELKRLPPSIPTTIPDLIYWWENQSTHWNSLKPRMRDNYRLKFKYLIAWSITLGHPHVKSITTAMVRQFIDSGVLKPALMASTRATLSTILSHAVEMGIINENPCAKLATFKRPSVATKQIITLWRESDVEKYVQAALDFNWLGGAILIQGLWDSGARITDGTKWRKADLNGQYLTRETNKSDEKKYTIARMSKKFCNLVKQKPKEGLFLVTQPHHFRGICITSDENPDPFIPYTEAVDDNRLKTHFRSVQRRAMALGAPRLALKHLRHTAITQADLAGIKHNDLKANTAHTTASMAKERYIISNRDSADKIAKARGIK
jgi:hypothetical protein